MNWREDMAGESRELEQALDHFKASMDAWSDAALRRPRTVTNVAVRHNWRPAAGWALGCLLAAGSVAGAVHQIVHRQEMAQQAAQKAAAERAAAAREAALRAGTPAEKKAPAAATQDANAGAQDEALLASVNRYVSRQVPAAMEPLAQLMDDNGTK
jgi:hypothetical protein